jgi:hypothetical protein
MARVVQRQPSPPYLLIVFAGLFLAAMIGMVFFWIRGAQTGGRLAEAEANYRRVISVQELARPDPQLKEMLGKAERPPKGQPAQTVYAQQVQQISILAKLITGQQAPAEQAIRGAADLTEQLGGASPAGLIPQIRDLLQRCQQASQLSDSRAKMLQEAQQAMAQKDEAIRQLKADMDAKLDQLNQERLALEEQVRQRHQETMDQQDQSRRDLAQARAGLNATISNQVSQIQELTGRLDQADQMVSRLRAELDQRRGPLGQAAVAAARQADGKVLEVMEREGICYIDIGATSKVVPGLTFSVYPSTGIPEDGQGKAQVLITRVKDTISECRIVQQEPGNPIIRGDLAGNIAFSSQRTYSFVVGGEFDLRQTGTASDNDLEEVRMMVRRGGGTLADTIGVDTDFVVLGQEPPVPTRPLESAPATVWAAYNAQMERVNRYEQIRKEAQQMHVPILNTNRFLAFMGYAQGQAQ